MTGNTPANDGYSMPAEWQEHEGTWLQWPHNDLYEDSQLWLEHTWLAMTIALHQHETVHIIVTDERRGEQLQRQITYYGLDERNIDIHIIPNNDIWVRDNGPIFLLNEGGQLAATDWNFNGWGERFPFDKDCKVPASVAARLSIPLYVAPIVAEGGGIEVNGNGTLLATRTSIINANRNPGKSQDEIESVLKAYLGIEHFIWLSGAPKEFCDAVGDDTDFHIDGSARFVNETTVLYTWTDDTSDPNYPYFQVHKQELESAVTESGEALTLVPLLIPENRSYATRFMPTRPPFVSKPALAIYTNYYVANGVVLVPVYGDINDATAKSIIAEHFPDREIIGIPAHSVAEVGGMMHCVTQQQPLGTVAHLG
jgi:agmatine deiminase